MFKQQRQPAPIVVGSLLSNRYRLLEQIGEGGAGIIYKSEDTQLKRTVAVKVLTAGGGMAGDMLERFRSEARSVARLNHPNIVTLFDYSEEQGQPYLVMEFVPGQDLWQLNNSYDSELIPFEESLPIIDSIFTALAYSHKNQVIHRDLKPENIMITPEKQVKVMDFGLARIQGQSRLTQVGLVAGTASYMAPEAAMGETGDHRVDLYAMGVIMYELLAGRLPFSGDDPLSIISQHIHAPVVPPQHYNPNISEELQALILKLLSKDPNDRYQTANEVRQVLAPILLAVQGGMTAALSQAIRQSMPTQGFPTSEALLNRIARGKMVGREDELTELKRRWDKVCLGEPVEPVLLIAGEPGIGKTRLIRELQVYSNLRDGYVLQSTAQEQDAGSPYVTIATALRKYVHEQPFEVLRRQTPGFIAGEVVKFAPELAEKIGYVPPNPPLEPTAERDRLLEQISNFLLNLAHERPTLLLFDDLHYADPGSLEILETMARNSSGASLLIAAAYRDVALSHSSPVNHFLRTLQFNRLAHRIPLRRLSRRAVEQMLEALLGDTVSQKFLDSIYETTEGNPLFVEEVVKGLVVDGQIVLFDGHWTQRDSGVVQVPGGIKSVLGSRLERITKPTLEILQIAAVIGRNFSLDTLSQASPYNDEATQQAIAEALQLQLIDPQKSPQQIISAENLLFQFQHSFIRETLYEELRPLRRRRLHRKVAEAIEKLAGQDGVSNPAVLARHFIDGAQDEKAVSYLHRAGDAARQFYANAEAVDHFSQAREILEDIAPDLQGEELRANIAEQFQLLEKESNVFGLMGNRSRQLEALQKSKELAEALNEKERWVEVTAQLATYYWGIGELDQALETARQGMTVAQQHQDRRGELACLEQVVRVLWTRRDSEAMTYATQALVIAQELRDRPREGQLTQLVGHIYADTLHDPRRASIYFNQALEICRTAGNHLEEAWTLWGMGGLALFIDDYVTALARYSQAKGIAESLGATLQVGWDLYHMGDAWYSLGNNEQALDCYQQAQVIFNKARHQRGQIYSQISLGLTYMAMAQLDEVLNYLDKARQAAEARNDSTLIFRSYQALAAYYCLLGGQANLTYAVRLSNRIIQMASGKNYFEHELLGYYLRGSGFLGLGQINEGLSSSKEAITRLENLTYLHSPQISAAEIYYRHSLILTRASQPDVAQIYLQKAYNETTRKANLIANEQQRATFLNIRLNREIMAASRAG